MDGEAEDFNLQWEEEVEVKKMFAFQHSPGVVETEEVISGLDNVQHTDYSNMLKVENQLYTQTAEEMMSTDQMAAENLMFLSQDVVSYTETAELADDPSVECVTEEVITDDWVIPGGQERVEVPMDHLNNADVVPKEENDLDVPLPTDQDEYTAMRPWPCDFCSRRFRKKAALMNHMVAHQNDRPHACNLCGVRYVRKCDLMNHLKVHAFVPENPDSIDYDVLDNNQIVKPKKKRGRRKKNPEPVEENGMWENMTSARTQQWSRRARSPARPPPTPPSPPPAPPAPSPPPPPSDPSRPFVCRHCGVGFAREKALQSHARVHGGDSPVECGSCGELCWSREALATHAATRHPHLPPRDQPPDPPYEDSDSGDDMEFRLSPLSHGASDRAVYDTMRGPELFCQDCGVAFQRADLLRRHVAAAHRRSRKMPFKIIETIERGRRLIAAVPSSWESDGNLYWPRKNVISLKKNEKSTPQSDWKCLSCILLRDNILDYKTAEQETIVMSDATDTDNKENEHPRTNTSITLNLNNLAMECIQANKLAEETSPKETTEHATSLMAAKDSSSTMATEDASSVMMVKDLSSIMEIESNALIPTVVNNILIQDLSQENTSDSNVASNIQNIQPDEILPEHDLQFTNPSSTVTETIQVPQEMGYFIEMMSAIQENQKVLFENQQNILKGLAKINTKLDEYFTRSQGPFQQERQEQPPHFKIITNIDELTNFEEQLKCPLMVSKYFEELSIICSHKKSAQNNAYALVDSMFDRKLMTRCSWGGGSKGEPKHCFKAFSKTIDLFLKVVHQYDETFTKPNCEDFFKNVMRHSTKRNEAKRVRSSTTKKKNRNRAAENQLQDADRPGQGLPNISDQTQ